jgi:hypothetical protein
MIPLHIFIDGIKNRRSIDQPVLGSKDRKRIGKRKGEGAMVVVVMIVVIVVIVVRVIRVIIGRGVMKVVRYRLSVVFYL